MCVVCWDTGLDLCSLFFFFLMGGDDDSDDSVVILALKRF